MLNRQFHRGLAYFYKYKTIAMEMKKRANIITICRIFLSVLIFFFPAFSPMFCACYCTAGLTDMLDGAISRKTNTTSEFGSKFDTIADFVFIVVCIIKLLPDLQLSIWLYVWILIIAVTKIGNVISGYIVHKQFVALHTLANKITGVMLFLLPLTLELVELRYCGSVICAVASFAEIQEGHLLEQEKT